MPHPFCLCSQIKFIIFLNRNFKRNTLFDFNSIFLAVHGVNFLRIVCHRGVPDSTLSFQLGNGSRLYDAASHLFHDGDIGGLECETSPYLAALQKSEYADIPWTETLPKCYTRRSAKVRVGKH